MPVIKIRVIATSRPGFWSVSADDIVIVQSTREPLRELAIHLLAAGFSDAAVIHQVATPAGRCQPIRATLAAVLRAPDCEPFATPKWTNGVNGHA